MMENNSFVKLYRDILNGPVFQDPIMLKLYIYITCSVTYCEKDEVRNGKIIHLMPGEMIAGRKALAQRLEMSEKIVYARLQSLKKLGLVDIKSNNKFSLISVANWEFLQGSYEKKDSKRTAKEQQKDSKRTAEGHQIRNKEIYNINNNIYTPPIVPQNGDEKPQREVVPFGENGNVLISLFEYETLESLYGDEATNAIAKFDFEIEESERNRKRNENKNHYAVLRKRLSKVKPKPKAKADDGRLSFNMEDVFERI